MDLAQWLADGRTIALLDLIEQLPRTARLWEAQAQDPEVAAERLNIEETQPPSDAEKEAWSPRVAEWGLNEQMIADLIDAVEKQTYILASIHGGKPTKPGPFPRPRTALDKAREARDIEYANTTMALFGFDEADFF